MSFPNDQIELCLKQTNKQLQEHQKRETSVNEIYELFGIIILITRHVPDTTSFPMMYSNQIYIY